MRPYFGSNPNHTPARDRRQSLCILNAGNKFRAAHQENLAPVQLLDVEDLRVRCDRPAMGFSPNPDVCRIVCTATKMSPKVSLHSATCTPGSIRWSPSSALAVRLAACREGCARKPRHTARNQAKSSIVRPGYFVHRANSTVKQPRNLFLKSHAKITRL
jgi:hypothetical protein